MKVTTKLTGLFLLLSIIPLAVVGYLAYDNGRRAIEQDTINNLNSITILKEAEFNRWVEDSERRLRELARRPLIRDYAVILASLDPADPKYQAAYKNTIHEHLNPTLEEEGGFLEFFILRGKDGLILVSTDEKQVGKYRESESYFVGGKNRTYVQNVYYSLSMEKAALTIGTPVKDKEGNLVAVLAGHVDLTEMSDIMMQYGGLHSTEETYLVNKFNFFVTDSRFEPGYALKKAIHTEGVEACLTQRNNGFALYDDYRGVPVIGVYRWIPERELCIITEIDQTEAFASVIALRKVTLGIGVAMTLIVVVFALLFARTITKPVFQLVEGTEELGRGNLEYRVGMENRGDEIGQLSRAFNQMAENLKTVTASRDELNKEIAERKRAEEALEEYSENLEKMVKKRTKELEDVQEQLVRRERLAVLGQLSGGVAHELRSPLGAIRNAAYFLNMVLEEPEPEVKESLDILEKEVAASDRIINSLLDFARPKPLAPEEVNINDVIQDMLSRSDVPENVEVVSQLDESLPNIQADSTQLGIVFGNIIRNAIQAMLEGGKLVVKSEVPGPEWVAVSFADTGVGIPPEDVPKLFEPLFTTKAKGIGLGLAIIKNLIEKHGGTIEVESEVGKGTTFTVKLPIGGGEGI